MDTLDFYRDAIERVLTRYASLPESNPEIHAETVFDRVRDHYVVIEVGWENGYRIYGNFLHVDILNDKVWIQHDGTEDGIVDELIDAGIPKDRIVMGFRHISQRKHMEFAVA